MIHHDPNIFPTSSIHISGSHLGIAAELLCHLLDWHFTHRIHGVGVLSKGRASRKRKWGWNLCKNCGTSWSNAHIYTCYTVILCLTMLYYTIPYYTIYMCIYSMSTIINYANEMYQRTNVAPCSWCCSAACHSSRPWDPVSPGEFNHQRWRCNGTWYQISNN